MFSPECFSLWLNTRSGVIQHPEQTFHRTVVAHIRGTDTRKPFPEDIEREILRVLRRSDRQTSSLKNKVMENPWDRCFDNSVFNVGKMGFKHKGFHERKHLTEPVEKSRKRSKTSKKYKNIGDKGDEYEEIISLKRKRENSHIGSISSLVEAIEGQKLEGLRDLNRSSSESQFLTHHEDQNSRRALILPLTGSTSSMNSTPRTEMNDRGPFNHPLMQASSSRSPNTPSSEVFGEILAREKSMLARTLCNSIGCEYEQKSLVSKNAVTPWQQFVNFSQKRYGPYGIALFEKVASAEGLTLFPAALIFMLDQPVPKNDLRFDHKFLYPPREESTFLPGRPIGKLLFADDFWRISDACPVARKMLAGEVIGRTLFNHVGSLIDTWFSFDKYYCQLMKAGSASRRKLLRKADGTLGLFLMKCHRKGAIAVEIEFQEITDLFPEYMKLPFFI